MAKRSTVAVVSGIVTAGRFATKAYEPSLMPRSTTDQGLVTGGALVAGFVAGATASFALDLLPRAIAKPLIKSAGLVVTGSRTASLLGRTADTIELVGPQRAGWLDLGSEVLTALAYSRVVQSKASAVTKLSATGALGASLVADTNASLTHRNDIPDRRYVATSAGIGVGSALGLGAMVGLIRLGGRLATLVARRRSTKAAMFAIGSAATAAGLGTAASSFVARRADRIAAGNRATEIAYGKPPDSVTVSGGPASEIPFSTLGLQGRRFVSCATPARTIEHTMGQPAEAQPVRVYVGVESAGTIEERVDLAIAELDRFGAFDLPRIVAACPSGTGYVNYIAIEAAELVSLGACATVAVQYGSLPSVLSLNKVAVAAETYQLLIERLRAEIDLRGSACELLAFGESLGALAGQTGVYNATRGTDDVVDRSLWVGTPMGSPLFDELTADGVPIFDSPDDLRSYTAGAPTPTVVLLSHDNDPVTKFSMEDAYRAPYWLTLDDRGRGTNPHQRWLPGITFLQGLIDTKNAATVVPGEFLSSGHDYRADLGTFVAVAYGFDSVTLEQMARVEGELRASEIARSEAISLGTIHDT